jgi:hypothetical protein
MQLNLTKERDAFRSQIAAAVTAFRNSAASKRIKPITRVDIKYDLTSEKYPRVWVELDTEPKGEPDTGRSETYQIMERVCKHWARPCHAANDGEEVTVVAPGGSTVVDDEESLCEAVGLFFVDLIQALREAGAFDDLPRAEKCYLGVSTYDGVYGWPAWEDRDDNML